MRTTLKQTLAGAWMLLAALALSTAGCSQLEDTPDATNVATGNEPISISIAPKPSFEAGDADTRSADAEAQTRSTVDGSGNFAWAAGDKVYVILTFDDLAATKKEQLWVKATAATNGTPVAGWNVYTGWDANPAAATALTDQTWPVGAKTCKVQAFHTNCGHTAGTDGLTNFTYADGMGDHMIFIKEGFKVGETLAIAFEHSNIRITFTGLKKNTEYRLKLGAAEVQLFSSFVKSTFKHGSPNVTKSFTTNDNGTFTRCMSLPYDANTGKVELTIYDANGTTSLSKGTLQAQSSAGSWVTNGYRYTMKVSDFTGEINPGNRPDLLQPDPIVPGAKVHEINGYFITQPVVNSTYQWNPDLYAATMKGDPCKGYGKWRLPTMKDFEAIAGWTTRNPFKASNVMSGTVNTALPNPTAFHAAFSGTHLARFWSSDRTSSRSYAFAIQIVTGDQATYMYHSKTGYAYVRCVQPITTVTP